MQTDLLYLLGKYRTCFLIAPSFAIDFKFPNLIGMLKNLGADKITELTFGAKIVNEKYIEYIKNHPNQKYFIASPCPALVSLIKTQYKELTQYLVPVVSPFIAQTKIVKKVYPKHKIIFISPCKAKALIEAKEYKDIVDFVITYKELKQLFEEQGLKEKDFDNCKENFDSLILSKTKIYPISGGLASSSNIKNYFKENEILVSDGIKNIKNILDQIKNNSSKYKFFDLLSCDGGCIGGPEINNKNLAKEEKKEKILKYKTQMDKEDVVSESHIDQHKKEIANIDFSRKF
jgi:iron only hydrogenase large subunit-like protein